MRLSAFLLLGLLLIVVQGDLFLLLEPLHLQPFRPSLIIPLLVYLSVTEANLALAAAVGFLLGYVLDVVSGAPIGLFTFTSVGTVALARVVGGRAAARAVARGGVGRALLAGLFAILGAIVANVLIALFNKVPYVPLTRMKAVLPYALGTTLVSPLVYAIAERTRALASRFADPSSTTTNAQRALGATIERRENESGFRGEGARRGWFR